MFRFNAAAYVELTARLQSLEDQAATFSADTKKKLAPVDLAASDGLFESMIGWLQILALELSLKFLRQLIGQIRAGNATYGDVERLLGELRRRIVDELDSRQCFYMGNDKAKLYGVKNAFGEAVATAFASATLDIEEAGDCLAFERYTASVFHLMRVMEHGLRALAIYLNVPFDFKTWDPIIKKMRAEVENYATSSFKGNLDFMRQALERLTSVQLALRNEVMHSRSFYDEERARDIYRSVLAFMQQLATHLHDTHLQTESAAAPTVSLATSE